ncbi:MDM34 [Sanghuangporus weigelae]
MSFSFQWPRFSEQFHKDAIQLLNNALNKGTKPPVIADKIEVVELEMGTQPPELEIRDIGEFTTTQFRGIFRFSYAGDAHIVLKTKVQANPLYHKKADIYLMSGSRGMVAANQPLIVPMLLRLSNFKLSSYVVLVMSKQKGITLVFKTDPLQNVDINSTFDSFTVIQKFIQKEIENQLRQMFREDLPSIIHRLSQQWIKKSTTVEAPYLARRPMMYRQPGLETMSNPDYTRITSSLQPISNSLAARRGSSSVEGRPSSLRSISSRPSLSNLRTPSEMPQLHYDQESGTFKTEIPERRAFSHLGRIHRESRGLADLAEEGSEYGGTDGEGSFDVVNWEDAMTDIIPPSVTELESIPAVGGGVITRPRVYHASSLLHQTPTPSAPYARSPSFIGRTSSQPRLARSFVDMREPALLGQYRNLTSLPVSRRTSWDTQSIPDGSLFSGSAQYRSSDIPQIRRTMVEDDVDEIPFDNIPDGQHFDRQQSSTGEITAPSNPSSNLDGNDTSIPERASASRRSSVSSHAAPPSTSAFSDISDAEGEAKIVLRPGFNNAVSQLSLLNRSNHTLSPYTRPLEHFMIRSVPPKTMMSRERSQGTITERQPVKATRKRTWRLGGGTTTKSDDDTSRPQPDIHTEIKADAPDSSSSAASDFDVSEIDRYFRSRDDNSPHIRTPNLEPQLLYPAYLRHRSSFTQRKL